MQVKNMLRAGVTLQIFSTDFMGQEQNCTDVNLKLKFHNNLIALSQKH
jgi:hypothetical protein